MEQITEVRNNEILKYKSIEIKKFSYQTQNRMENNYEHRDGDKARK